MPDEGFKTISVREKVYEAIFERATRNRRSLANELEVILEEAGLILKRVPAR